MNVPKLRFKEFNDEWKILKLSNISNCITKGTTPKKYSEEGINFIKVENIHNNIISNINSFISNEVHNGELKRSILQENDILFSIAGALGRVAIIGKDLLPANTNQACSIIRLNSLESVNLNYLINRLNNIDVKNYIFKCQSVGAQPNLSLEQVCNIKISLPAKEEQEKIGKLLSLLDKKIELQTKKIEDLKLYKKGLINILNDYSFKETTLGEIGYFQTSSIDKLIKENEIIVNLYNYMDVYKHKIIMSKDLQQLSKTSAKESQIITNCLNRGDILFTPSSETPDDIGHSICIQENLINTVYSYHLLRFRPNIEMNLLFSNYYFNNSKIRNQIIKYATGATRYTVSLDCFSKIKIKIPDSITQKKYGKLLYNADIKINIESRKLDKLIGLKKGLMQNMFV